jgi:hypothetical protein
VTVGRTTTARSADPARSTAEERGLAWRKRELLVLAAVTLVASDVRPPGAGRRARLLAVATRLAHLPGAPSVVPTERSELALARFTEALVDAADAIRHCRRTEHVGGGCWFGVGGARDACDEALHLLHELG